MSQSINRAQTKTIESGIATHLTHAGRGRRVKVSRLAWATVSLYHN